MKAYALIDPNWGEPKPVIDTIAETFDDCMVLIERSPSIRLYGGGSEHPYPQGTKNKLDLLVGHGYRVRVIEITITGE